MTELTQTREEQHERAGEPGGDRGRTIIAEGVVAKIAGIAAREVAGVHDLVSRGPAAAIAGVTQKMLGGDKRGFGVSVEVGEREAAVDLGIVVNYGASIPQVAEALRRNIMNRIQAMTGLTVKEVNISVEDLYFPEEEQPPTQAERRVA